MKTFSFSLALGGDCCPVKPARMPRFQGERDTKLKCADCLCRRFRNSGGSAFARAGALDKSVARSR
jgi:hypothetical protein